MNGRVRELSLYLFILLYPYLYNTCMCTAGFDSEISISRMSQIITRKTFINQLVRSACIRSVRTKLDSDLGIGDGQYINFPVPGAADQFALIVSSCY
jgi:hypothetical protein